MSNYYNNNNRGRIYSIPNNLNGQRGQNSYLNNNNYNRPHGSFHNNYNKGNFNYNQNINNNYQQQNYNNQNQQNNNDPRPFISAYMGRILISSDTLQSFGNNLKKVEWTNNQNYLQAKNINVKIKMSLQGQLQSDINIPKNRFNNYNLNSNSNFNMNNFINFIKEVNDNNNKKREQIENEKNNFMRQNFPNEKPDLKMDDLYIKIGQNRKDVIKNDSSLYRKVEKLLPLLKPIEVPEDFDIKESNLGAPSGPNFISGNDDGKIFTNTNTPCG